MHCKETCEIRQHTAQHCNETCATRTLQRAATHCNTLHRDCEIRQKSATHCNSLENNLQHTATHCNTLQHTAERPSRLGNALQNTPTKRATHCNTLSHTVTHCNMLQRDLRIRRQTTRARKSKVLTSVAKQIWICTKSLLMCTEDVRSYRGPWHSTNSHSIHT